MTDPYPAGLTVSWLEPDRPDADRYAAGAAGDAAGVTIDAASGLVLLELSDSTTPGQVALRLQLDPQAAHWLAGELLAAASALGS